MTDKYFHAHLLIAQNHLYQNHLLFYTYYPMSP
nr:MAG TPA: hypothetical protein [Bacteriophage sp.]